MTTDESIRDDLDYVASTVRRQENQNGVPAIYFLWAAITLVGFSLPDFAPQAAGPFWFFAGIGGGLLSWWLGARAERKKGIHNKMLGRRYGLQWTIGGVGFLLAALPMFVGRVSPAVDPALATAPFLLVGGLVYALAGVHLERPLLWVGLLMLAAYVVIEALAPPYVWTITGVVIALSLLWSGWMASRGPAQAAH
ncbi:MAG: hypothetical protein ACREP2_00280 [Rhodanobacteraceae bacterium]